MGRNSENAHCLFGGLHIMIVFFNTIWDGGSGYPGIWLGMGMGMGIKDYESGIRN
jgi:hypothetical protein